MLLKHGKQQIFLLAVMTRIGEQSEEFHAIAKIIGSEGAVALKAINMLSKHPQNAFNNPMFLPKRAGGGGLAKSVPTCPDMSSTCKALRHFGAADVSSC
jgi:hypothetical protein